MTPDRSTSYQIIKNLSIHAYEDLEFTYEDGMVNVPYVTSSTYQNMQQPSIFCVSFGNKKSPIHPETINHKVITRSLVESAFCCPETEYCILQKQTHGTKGAIIDRISLANALPSMIHEGDFLITNLPNTALGILTADYLPILIADPIKNIVAAIHAGWKGSVGGIVKKAIESLIKEYNCDIESLEVYFGPSARACCYEVIHEFLLELTQYNFWRQTIIQKQDALYFDNVFFSTLLLQELGFKKAQIHTDQAICTICSDKHCSHRASKGAPERQLSTICMHTIK